MSDGRKDTYKRNPNKKENNVAAGSPSTSPLRVSLTLSPIQNFFMTIIPNGCILIARKIQESEVWCKPAWWYKVFSYLIMEVSYKDKTNKKGTGFFQYSSIFKDCHLDKDEIKQTSIDNLIRWMRDVGICTTQKTTRGIYITLCNYGHYQNIKNYKTTPETRQERDRNETITKEGKEGNKEETSNKKQESLLGALAPGESGELLKGREKKGEETNGQLAEFWTYFLLKTGRNFKLTPPLRKLIMERLNIYKLTELKRCVDAFVADDWVGRKKYFTLDYCIGHMKGKPDAVEMWLNKPVKKVVRYV